MIVRREDNERIEKLKECDAEIQHVGQVIRETRDAANSHKAALQRLSDLQELRRTLTRS